MKEIIRPALVSLLAFTVLCGFVYPLVMDGIAAAVFPHQATGSLIHDQDGHVVGSELIGQLTNAMNLCVRCRKLYV